MKKQHRILISRPDRIGDVVLSTPIPREIKKTFPNAFVVLLVRNYTKDIFLNNPNVDDIIIYNENENTLGSFFKKIKEIRKFKFTHALMLLPNEQINYLLFFSGIPFRVGVGHKFYQFITFTKYVWRRNYNPLRHEADYCMDLARRIGVKPNDLSTEIVLSNEEKKCVLDKRNDLLNNKKFVVGVHISSGNSAPNWLEQTYFELIRKLSSNSDFKIVVTDNKEYVELKNITSVEFPNINKSLRESILNFAALDLLISASTGPMHICAALKVKTLSMFCPMTACSPELWAPLGNESKIVLPETKYCASKCPGDPKKCNFEGEGGINPEIIYNEVIKILQ